MIIILSVRSVSLSEAFPSVISYICFKAPVFSNLEKKTRFFLEGRRSFRFKIGVKDLIWLPLILTLAFKGLTIY